MDLLRKGYKSGKNEYKRADQTFREQADRIVASIEAKREAERPHGEELFKIKDADRRLENKLTVKYRERFGEIKAEAAYVEGSNKTMYQPAPISKEKKLEDERATAQLRAEKNNNFIDIYDIRICDKLKAARAPMQDEARIKAAYAPFEQEFKVEGREWDYRVYRSPMKDLAEFMTGDVMSDKQLLKDYLESGVQKQEEMLMGMIEEVMSYNFSAAMMNKYWLADNVQTLLMMQKRIDAVTSLIRNSDTFSNKLPKKVENILNMKSNQADILMRYVNHHMEECGIDFEDGYKSYTVKEGFTEANREDVINKQWRTSSEKCKEEFRKKKAVELKLFVDDDTAYRKIMAEDPERSAENLTFEDFAAMTGTKNRGQIILRGGKLAIINNGFFCRKKGDKSYSNRLVKERFMAVVCDRLGDDAAVFRPHLMSILHLYDKEDKDMLPLTRSMIASVMEEINTFRSKVERNLKNGKGHEDNQDYKIANRISQLIGKAPVTKDEKKAMKAKIKSILQEAPTFGMPKFSLNEHQMDNLVNTNIELLRDNMFDALSNLDNIILNINGGQDKDPAGWLSDEELIKRVAIWQIRRLAENTSELPQTADTEMSLYLTTKAFSIVGKGDLKGQFDSLYIGDLSREGDMGFYETLAARKEQIGPTLYNTENFQKTAQDFAILLSNLSFLQSVNEKWLLRQNQKIKVDLEEYHAAAKAVDAELSNKHKFDIVLNHLQGTRFYNGYMELRRRRDDEMFSFGYVASSLKEKMKPDRKIRNSLRDAALEEIETRRIKLSEADKAAYEKFSDAEKTVADILMGHKPISSLVSEPEDDAAKTILYIRKVLRDYGAGESFIMTIPLCGTTMRLEQKRNNALYLSSGGKQIMLPYSARRLADLMEVDMTENLEKYGEKNAYDLVNSNLDSQGEDIRQANLCYTVLGKLTGKKADYFINLTTQDMRSYIRKITNAKPEERAAKIQELHDEVAKLASMGLFTEQNTLGFLIGNEAMNKAKEGITVELAPTEKRKFAPDEPRWTKEEETVKDFISDIVFAEEAWEMDIENERNKDNKRGERLISVITRNTEAAFLIAEDRKIIDRVMEKMSFPDVKTGEGEGGEGKSIKKQISEDIQKIFEDKDLKEILAIYDKNHSKSTLKFNMARMLQNKKKDGSLERIEARIDQRVKQISESMQAEITKSVNIAFPEAEQREDVTDLQDPYEENLTRDQQEERIKKRGDEITARIDKEYKSNSGQGRFIKEVLNEYFIKADIRDQRVMVAAMLRNSKPKKDMEKATEDEKKTEETRLMGITFGGYLKGAGPLLQKILQGLPEQGMPEAMQMALSDMKSNLTPIPDQVVRQRMDQLIQRSHNEITKIDVVKSLGAASVGQAFLCKLYGPLLPAEGKEVVIKLLRSEARNRMERERSRILESADKVPGGGMRATYEGQIRKIEEEFDLRIEEKNAKLGTIYNNGDTTVTSVGLEDLLPATATSMVLEKADGTTVDRYMKDIESMRDDVLKNFYQYDENKKVITDPETKRPVLKLKEGKASDITKARKVLEEKLQSLMKRQLVLTSVAKKWVTEGIYGSGFYHGDLHAGNIMITDEKATIIDYGNAIQLTPKQQLEITRLTAAVSVGNRADFVEAFHQLLESTPEETWNQKKPLLEQEVDKVFAIGAKELSGQMISLILMRAQSIGLEVPAAINNFSQSQIRLQNTIDSMNEKIYGIRKDIEELSALDIAEPKFDIGLIVQHESKAPNADQDQVIKKYLDMISVDAAAILKEIRLTSRGDKNAFINNRVNILPQGARRDALISKLEELREAQSNKRANLKTYEDAVVEAYLEAFKEYRTGSELAAKLRASLNDDNAREETEKELAFYFDDISLNGKVLSDAYKAYRLAKENGATAEEITKTQNIFLELYLAAAEERLRSMQQQRTGKNVKIKSFFKVMRDVTNTHLTASLKRLGVVKSGEYMAILQKRTLAKSPDEISADKLKKSEEPKDLVAIRKKVATSLPENIPDTLNRVRKDRDFAERIEGYMADLESQTADLANKNAVYYKNKDESNETDAIRKANRETSLAQVWNEIYTQFISGKDWRSGNDIAGNGDKVFIRMLTGLMEALETDFARMEAEKSFLVRQEMEQELYRTLVMLPREEGQNDFLEKIMNGQAEEGGELFDKHVIYNEEEQNAGKTNCATLLALHGFKDLTGDDAKLAKRFISKVLMLFGEKLEKGYNARQIMYGRIDKVRKQHNKSVAEAREKKYDGTFRFETWIEWDHEGNDLADKYRGEDGLENYITQMKANGWDMPHDEALFRSLYKYVMDADKILEEKHQKDLEERAKRKAEEEKKEGKKSKKEVDEEQAEKDKFLRTYSIRDGVEQMRYLLADMVNNKLESTERRVQYYNMINSYLRGTGGIDSNETEVNWHHLDPLIGKGIRAYVDRNMDIASGELSYQRFKHKADQAPVERRIHTKEDFVKRAKERGWHENDNKAIEEMYDVLCNAYKAKSNAKTQEEKEAADKVIAGLEKAVTAIETERLFTPERRLEILGEAISVIGDGDSCCNAPVGEIRTAYNTKLTKEHADKLRMNSANYEALKAKIERIKKRNKDNEEKNAKIGRARYKMEPVPSLEPVYEVPANNKFARYRKYRKTSYQASSREAYQDKGSFRDFYAYYCNLVDVPSKLLVKGEYDSTPADRELMKQRLQKCGLNEELTEALLNNFFTHQEDTSEVAEMMTLLLGYINYNLVHHHEKRLKSEIPIMKERIVLTALELLDINDGASDQIELYNITGVGTIKREDSNKLRVLLLKEKADNKYEFKKYVPKK